MKNDACEQKDISVETVDISKGGIAFITKKNLRKGDFLQYFNSNAEP